MYSPKELHELGITLNPMTNKFISNQHEEMSDLYPLVRSMSVDSKGNFVFVGDVVMIKKKKCTVRYGQYKLMGQVFEGFYLDAQSVIFNIHTSRIGKLIGNVFEVEQ